MSTDDNVSKDNGSVPEPQGRILGVPYDLRRPTIARIKSRWWNPSDHRILTPKAFGAGWDMNLYWFVHPLKYLLRGRAQPSPKA